MRTLLCWKLLLIPVVLWIDYKVSGCGLKIGGIFIFLSLSLSLSPDEIPSLLEGLLLYGHTHEARQLHRLFTELMTSVRTAVERAWPQETTPTNTQVYL